MAPNRFERGGVLRLVRVADGAYLRRFLQNCTAAGRSEAGFLQTRGILPWR